ncbi:FAD-dependent oxidoreductase [Marinicrinis sediminis]|uniref:FAD-dependent oxidoreductase n=1 Tax=Marinicrinis sediminis TaxID=1652465 RepID=A0ABW5RAR9_9BACL
MREETVNKDITVIGGGLAGVCAAVAAARSGCTVALVQNRPVLGGNASSEVRVWVCGATAHGINRYARETGIMGELFVENQYRNPDGNPYIWDLVVLEKVKAEPNIELFLNTDVQEVEADQAGKDGQRVIHSVTGWMMASERRIRFESSMFLDCTGDGLIGFLAGAKFRLGREAQHEYQEMWAPEQGDEITLGSTILFYTKDAGHPVKFVPPAFAKDINETPIPIKRVIRSGDSGCHYWWIEWGGELDTVYENERIRDELWSVIYGIWDYIKNSGRFDSETMTLEWVGAVPGKREYRRFTGDYVLNQNDILAQEPFDDRIGFGGWSIDLHPPQGMYAEESGSKHMHADGIYHIPFRSLYSANVSNLMFAGRDISATHVAFGTTRVMATCAVIGEAAGAGAAFSVRHELSPREVYQEHMQDLQQEMLKMDAALIGLPSRHELNLAQRASVQASSCLTAIDTLDRTDSKAYPLSHDIGIILPVDPGFHGLDILVDAKEQSTLRLEVWGTGKKENYVPTEHILTETYTIEKGTRQLVSLPCKWTPDEAQNAFVIIRQNEALSLYVSQQPHSGMLCFQKEAKHLAAKSLEDRPDDQLIVQWSMRGLVRHTFCISTRGETEAFTPQKGIDGYLRPYGGPHMWLSLPIQEHGEQWIMLSWEQEQLIRDIHLTFNDDVNEDLINLHHHRTPFEVIPELVRDYRIEAYVNDRWLQLLTVRDNRQRKQIHRLPDACATRRLRVVVEQTNGSPHAELIEMAVYS